MLNPRWRKVLRDLWSNKSRTLLVVLSIGVGVFTIGTILGAQVILDRDLSDAYTAARPANLRFFMSPFEKDLVESVQRMKEVEVAEGRRQAGVRVLIGPDEWRDLTFVAVPDYEDIKVSTIKPQRGAWPPPEQQFLMERASIALLNAKEGDTLLIETFDGKQRKMEIAGLVHDIHQPPAALLGIPFGYVTFDTLRWLGLPDDYDQLHIRVAAEEYTEEDLKVISNKVQNKIEKGNHSVFNILIREPGKHPIDDILQPMLLLLGGVGFLSIGLSGFLVVNIISALLAQHMRQIGVMKAIGARRDQLIQMYYATVLVFGLLSLLVAVPLGILGARGFTSLVGNFLNVDIVSFSVPTNVLLMQILVGLLVPVIAATQPVLMGTRVTVHEAMSSYGLDSNFGTRFTDRLMQKIQGLPRPLLISLRNTFRRQGRLILTLITLTLASAIFVSVFTIRESLLLTLDEALSFWNYDVAVIFNRPYRIEQLEREALRVPGVVAAESWGRSNTRIQRPDGTESDSIDMFGPRYDTTLVNPKIIEGRWLLPEDENAIVVTTDLTSDEPEFQVGSNVVLSVAGRETDWQVVGIARGTGSNPVIFANYPYLARKTGEVGRGGWILITTAEHDAEFQSRVAIGIEEHFKTIGIQVTQSFTIARLRGIIESFFNIIIVFLAMIAVLLAVVGGLGLMGTMSINVIERTREIGVMRAIGASNGTVLQIFITEGIFISLLSWTIGTLIALPLSKVLTDAVGNVLFQAPLSYRFSISGALIWLALIILLASFASFWPARSAAKLSVREVLAYE